MSNLVHNEQVSWLRRLREILEGRLHSALFLACDAGLLQIELSLDASARPVGLNGGSVLQFECSYGLDRPGCKPQ
jgi:hypothetical protein